MVDLLKIVIILNLLALIIVAEIKTFLGYSGYHRKFIKGYVGILGPIEEILKKKTKRTFQLTK